MCTVELEGGQPHLNQGTGEREKNGSPRKNQDAVTGIRRTDATQAKIAEALFQYMCTP